jgi:hypothetical protein
MSRLLNGADASLANASWIGNWRVVLWQLSLQAQFNEATAWNSCTADPSVGTKTGRFQIVLILTAAKGTLPTIGERITNAVFTTLAGTTYTNDLRVQGFNYSINKGPGDDEQRVLVYGVVLPPTSGSGSAL